MKHIRQKVSENSTYTVVDTHEWTLPLEEHPCIIEQPEVFEISTDEIPENYQFLKYSN